MSLAAPTRAFALSHTLCLELHARSATVWPKLVVAARRARKRAAALAPAIDAMWPSARARLRWKRAHPRFQYRAPKHKPGGPSRPEAARVAARGVS